MAVRLGERLQRANGGRLGASLIKLGFLQDEDIPALLSKHYGVPAVNLAECDLDPATTRLIPAETANRYNVSEQLRQGVSTLEEVVRETM